MENYKPKEGHVLVLRTNDENNQSRGKFQYPTTGYIEAPDWERTNECGNGLHGALKGVGNAGLFNWNNNAIWMVLEVKETEIIDLEDKVKFKGGNVVYCGDRQEATQLLYNVYGNVGIIGLIYHSHKKEPIVGGYGSTITSGNRSTLTGGDYSKLTGGDYSILIGGRNSFLTGGNSSTLTGGIGSILTGGNRSTLTGGDYSILIGGIYSTLTGGSMSTLVGGTGSTLIGCVDSILTGGENSILNFKYWDGNRMRIKTYYVGENGIKPNTKYKLNNDFEIEEVN